MKGRKLQVHIVTLFLTLLACALILVITYSYIQNSKSIIDFSKGTAERTGALIMEKTLCLTNTGKEISSLTSQLSEEDLKIQTSNTRLIRFLLSEAKIFPYFSGQIIALMDGSFMEAGDLTMLQREQFINGTFSPIPLGTCYILRLIDRSKENPVDEWFYKDKNFETIHTQTFPLSYDPRKREWFTGTIQKKETYWTTIFHYILNEIPILSVSQPIFGKNGEILGVTSSLIPMDKLEGFLNEEKIGISGKAIIIDSSGNVVIPHQLDPKFKEASLKALSHFKLNQESAFLIESNGKEYLTYIKPFPEHLPTDWSLVILAPMSDFFGNLMFTQIEIALISLGILVLSALLAIYFSKRISAPIVELSEEVDKIKKLDLEGKIDLQSRISEISLLESSVNSTKMILRSFGRYIPKTIVKDLMLQGKEIKLGGQKKEVTIFFSDIEGFTSIAESLSPDDLMPLLSEYFDALSKIILENQGTIDKYIGDSIMAFWGAPIENEMHGYLACISALKCKQVVHDINRERVRRGKPEFKTRFGINSGHVFVGNIGTEERMNYTILGDAVNIAERLEQSSKIYHTEILVGRNIVAKWGEKLLFRPIDITVMKGKMERLKIFELMGEKGERDKEELIFNFTKGFDAFHQDDLQEAKKYFDLCLEKFPQDYPTKIYLKRIEER